ncbi:hypothetical protein HMPREF9019_0633 [Hoylesella timonensis CRIS 5C-B1]|uniref:Uncharacterized protein n=1 Tax=Hoylesella timonensis CRIS 5C-B1 TaxID=679189 RepID=D1VX68_9BACT|nr:hypothetical protein HMPREF9019_0633 [Hoylesella timonensis CRIS 5C-B1]
MTNFANIAFWGVFFVVQIRFFHERAVRKTSNVDKNADNSWNYN